MKYGTNHTFNRGQHKPSYFLGEFAKCSKPLFPISAVHIPPPEWGTRGVFRCKRKTMKNFGIRIFLFISAIIQASSVDRSLADSNSSLDVCNIVSCGKGRCNHTSSGRIFEDLIPTCECDQGWKQPNVGISISFLPCVIPDCSLDFSCSGKAPSSAPAPLVAQNNSTNPLHPCSYAVCGNGICQTTSDYAYSCKCDEGYETLLNITSAPCIRECSIGADCKNLGFTVGGRGKGTASAPVQLNTSNTEGVVGSVKHISHLMATAMVVTFICWA